MNTPTILAVAIFVGAGALILFGVILLINDHLLSKHTVAEVATEVSKYSRLIVAKRAGVTSVLGFALTYLTDQHVIPQPWSGVVMHAVNVGLNGVAVAVTVGGVVWAHRGVTPADPALHPKDIHGNDLVSALSVGPHPGLEPVPEAEAAIAAADAIFPTTAPTTSDAQSAAA